MASSAIDLFAAARMLSAMKTSLTALCLLCLVWTLPLGAQQAHQDRHTATELSEPPYAVGDRMAQQGHSIALEDGLSINFRIVANQIRVYWIDADGRLVEPRAAGGTVRLRGSVRGRDFFRLVRVSDDVALGSPGVVLPPHIFFVVLNLERVEAEGLDQYTFRYVPAMDRPVDAADQTVPSANN